MKTRILMPVILMLLFVACTPRQPAPEKLVSPEPIADSVTRKIITARVFVKSEKVADFIQVARTLVDSSNAEPGCESYMLYQNPFDKTNFIFVEIWRDQVAIDNHFSMPYFKAFGTKTNDWMSQPAELKIFDVAQNE